MRNHLKNWVKAFVMKKGVGNELETEQWGMFEGLYMAWNSGVRKVIVETDSLVTVQLLSIDTNTNHPLFSLIQNCIVKHVYREGNRPANGLAHMGHIMQTDTLFFDDPLPEISSIFDDDCRGLTLVRQFVAITSSSFSKFLFWALPSII
ncbi:hypothetical protein Dsin_014926 [Dipteronia sinensis]|uniref:RNase H type-1 domain-containing protein n=1 Tax=Dipteronia sinensis TaxID=43782 RepID=A0AAE0EAC6_9ROSI|nr:hypothetical protein Dsin_014926 [Dipteronia sinensis]